MSADLGVRVTPEAMHQRFDREAASCLEQVLCAAVQQLIAGRHRGGAGAHGGASGAGVQKSGAG